LAPAVFNRMQSPFIRQPTRCVPRVSIEVGTIGIPEWIPLKKSAESWIVSTSVEQCQTSTVLYPIPPKTDWDGPDASPVEDLPEWVVD